MLRVSDDGKGFDPTVDHYASARGHGLQSIHTRARGLGGELEVRSAPRRGATVVLRVPLTRRWSWWFLHPPK
jgi:signal transduction histidine kinase